MEEQATWEEGASQESEDFLGCRERQASKVCPAPLGRWDPLVRREGRESQASRDCRVSLDCLVPLVLMAGWANRAPQETRGPRGQRERAGQTDTRAKKGWPGLKDQLGRKERRVRLGHQGTWGLQVSTGSRGLPDLLVLRALLG